MSNPFSRAAIRREFPVTRVAPIIGENGKINRRSIGMHLSGNGCPNASVELVVAAMKSGLGAFEAIQLAMLAAYMGSKGGPMVECIDRMTRIISSNMHEAAAMQSPFSKWAEERAARLEGHESRWGTAEFHHAAGEEGGKANFTQHYPYRTL